MNIGLIAVDSDYPNLALMKISAYHKAQGDCVEWYTPFAHYDVVYMSKIFTFTEDWLQVINNADRIEKGGTGYDIHKKLPAEIDRLQPDYDLYNLDRNLCYGFLTRGCPNKCKWCIVPKKEGAVTPYMDIEELTMGGARNKAILMDNNILATDYGLEQLEKIIKMGIRVDFNQGLDARLVTDDIAKMLAKVKWIDHPRFGCDTPKQVGEVERVMQMMDKYGYNGKYFLYCILLPDFKETYERVNHWHGNKRVKPYAQPYRDVTKAHHEIPQWQKDMAHWCDRKWIYRSTEFADFEPRKGFKCSEYIKEFIA